MQNIIKQSLISNLRGESAIQTFDRCSIFLEEYANINNHKNTFPFSLNKKISKVVDANF